MKSNLLESPSALSFPKAFYGRGFLFYSAIEQLVACLAHNQEVAGSNPARATNSERSLTFRRQPRKQSVQVKILSFTVQSVKPPLFFLPRNDGGFSFHSHLS